MDPNTQNSRVQPLVRKNNVNEKLKNLDFRRMNRMFDKLFV